MTWDGILTADACLPGTYVEEAGVLPPCPNMTVLTLMKETIVSSPSEDVSSSRRVT
jgi:hypothetical protein